jgi:hypothetical protein
MSETTEGNGSAHVVRQCTTRSTVHLPASKRRSQKSSDRAHSETEPSGHEPEPPPPADSMSPMLSSCALDGQPAARAADAGPGVKTGAGGGAGRDCVARNGMLRILRPELPSAAVAAAVGGEYSGERERAREVRFSGDGLRGRPAAALEGGPSRSIALADDDDDEYEDEVLARKGLDEEEEDEVEYERPASVWLAASCRASRSEMKALAGGLEAYAWARPGRTRVGVVEGEPPAPK